MDQVDWRGDAISGATPAALEVFEAALASFQSWRCGTEDRLTLVRQQAPAFVMAHVLEAYLRLTSRDPKHAHSAAEALTALATLPTNARERWHMAAIRAALADDYEGAKTLLGQLLRQHPRDVIALQVAHALDYVTGDFVHIRDRVEQVLNAWSIAVPGYHAVLAMYAFGLEERGDYARAEEYGLRALSMDPFDARAHHVLAHVYEMTGRAESGVQWMVRRMPYWSRGTVVARHCWGHFALYRLAQGDTRSALAIYDQHVRADRSRDVSDLIDAAALLWRIELEGGDAGQRWAELASAWAPHVTDRFCTFNDLHATMACVGAHDWNLAHRLEHALRMSSFDRTRHGRLTREVGLPACRALIAFGRGDYVRARELLANLPDTAYRIGGSQAQRNVLQLTLARTTDQLGDAGRKAA